jgi:hypothetical protein
MLFRKLSSEGIFGLAIEEPIGELRRLRKEELKNF